jgi:hypothetical protein
MPQRLVVSFRGVVQPEPSSGDRYLARALALKKRAEALGATLCAWSAQTFSFDFDPGELEEAVTLAALAFERPADAAIDPTLTRSPPELRFSAGIAEGEMSAVGAGGAFAVLSWGPALVVAVTLARDAHAGEVLLDLDLLAHRAAEIERLDGMQVDFGRRRLVHRPATRPPPPAPARAASLTPSTPLPAVLTRPRVSLPPESASGQGAVGAVLLDGGRARRSPTLPPPPSAQSSGKIAALTGSSSPPPPPVVTAVTAATTVTAVTAATAVTAVPAVPAVSERTALAELAKRALIQGDIAAVERLISQLRETGEHHELVERMTGLVALRRGATAEALRRLRDAAEVVREPSQQARACLAYGVALATAGRSESALLEALSALARARAASDAQGERACALFLARLSAAAGHPDAASAWAVIAAHPAP